MLLPKPTSKLKQSEYQRVGPRHGHFYLKLQITSYKSRRNIDNPSPHIKHPLFPLPYFVFSLTYLLLFKNSVHLPVCEFSALVTGM